jgi:membrane protein
VVAWAITSVGFSIYLANFANYGVTYGSLGAAVGLLFYLYLSASIVLIGEEVNAAIHLRSWDTRNGLKVSSRKKGSNANPRDQTTCKPAAGGIVPAASVATRRRGG